MSKINISKKEIEDKRATVVDEINELSLNRFAGLRKYEIQERKETAELLLKLNWFDEILDEMNENTQ